MAVLDKYKVTTKPPKLGRTSKAEVPMEKIRKKFVEGVEKQKAQARAWKPGAKDLRSWVTRDEERGRAWITVKYGTRPVPIKGRGQATIGPVEVGKVPQVFDDLKRAAEAGELDAGLKKAAVQGPRKKSTA